MFSIDFCVFQPPILLSGIQITHWTYKPTALQAMQNKSLEVRTVALNSGSLSCGLADYQPALLNGSLTKSQLNSNLKVSIVQSVKWD